MNCFISQPMSNLSREEIITVRNRAATRIIDMFGHVRFPESYIDCTNQNYAWLLGNALLKLSESDFIFFTKGWENYLGCIVEYEAAKRIGLPMIFEENLNV